MHAIMCTYASICNINICIPLLNELEFRTWHKWVLHVARTTVHAGCCWKGHLLQACLSANSGNHPSQRWDSVQKLPAKDLLENVAAGTDLLIMFHWFLDHQYINHESWLHLSSVRSFQLSLTQGSSWDQTSGSWCIAKWSDRHWRRHLVWALGRNRNSFGF